MRTSEGVPEGDFGDPHLVDGSYHPRGLLRVDEAFKRTPESDTDVPSHGHTGRFRRPDHLAESLETLRHRAVEILVRGGEGEKERG